MQRVLDPAQIEPFGAQRTISRTRLPDPSTLFARRAARLRALAQHSAIADYLQLMAALCEAQHGALTRGRTPLTLNEATQQRIAQARSHGLPPLPASGWSREPRWHAILSELCGELGALPGFPEAVQAVCQRLRLAPAAELETQATQLLSGDAAAEPEAAPLVMAALQVYWVQLIAALGAAPDPGEAAAGRSGAAGLLCPLCGSAPVASVVRADGPYQGYRYLHCALCATEWHLVRVKCSQCQSTEGIHYHYIENGPDAVRAESCTSCGTYRKILYREKDPSLEAVADDLGSLALDLLMTQEGFRRASGNPLLWQPAT